MPPSRKPRPSQRSNAPTASATLCDTVPAVQDDAPCGEAAELAQLPAQSDRERLLAELAQERLEQERCTRELESLAERRDEEMRRVERCEAQVRASRRRIED
eukprot:gnl/TRDRNA2_/TRDRNA2_90900_c0_seq1.p2 gnl/TRDRNA2_/TRDRNA2_90900_c0~~gnl/TRDRNA2_/TRDRNA2_90900_c0_seq1.p2  ORF type:complete len:102 (+),score=24.41 gnl/TRDRNA2_/TRDRNA2_90900_c0_seq1:37-342(+)